MGLLAGAGAEFPVPTVFRELYACNQLFHTHVHKLQLVYVSVNPRLCEI